MALVDQNSRIRVWWTEEKAWYSGRVVSSKHGVHTVTYDDGVSLTHDLLKETWETELPVPKRKAAAKDEADAPKKRAKAQPPAQEAAAAPTTTTTKHDYAVGQQVEAKHQAQRRGSFAAKWFGGVVSKVHGDGACDIDYDDGDEEDRVPLRFLRPPRSPKPKVKAEAPAQEPPRAKQPAAPRQPKAAQQAQQAQPAQSEYELQRGRNIAENQQKLADLGLHSARDNCRPEPKPAKPRARQSKPRAPAAPSRASRRLSGEVIEASVLRDSKRLSADEFIVSDGEPEICGRSHPN